MSLTQSNHAPGVAGSACPDTLGREVTLDGEPLAADALMPLALANLGHFTSMRVDADGGIRGLALHMERLARDCRSVWGADLNTGRVRTYIRQALDGRRGPCVVRVTVYDPKVDIGWPAKVGEPRVLLSLRGVGSTTSAPLRVMSVPYERDLPEVKHVGLCGALHARRTAQLAGFGDALFVGRDGFVSEGVTWNVGFVNQDGTIVWPKATVLPGVTMVLLQQLTEHQVATITLQQAKGMAAAFATNASIGVRALSTIDESELPTDHAALGELHEMYSSIPGERA
ncbi:aminotransferase class IV family protein [Streptomyces sp. NPDC017056]|uniref:aminotransferase class IV family protein n=1 Tax=Streptomyces sp. NPDC017056 TaxID=3364973 RepID=UPI0037B7F467